MKEEKAIDLRNGTKLQANARYTKKTPAAAKKEKIGRTIEKRVLHENARDTNIV
jgi:hypothetical protein